MKHAQVMWCRRLTVCTNKLVEAICKFMAIYSVHLGREGCKCEGKERTSSSGTHHHSLSPLFVS